MEIAHINYVSKGAELFTTEASKTKIPIFHDEDSNPTGFFNEKSMEILKYRNFENVENSFIVTENLVMENSTEILNVSKNDCRSSCFQEVVKDKGTRLLGLSIMSWESDLFKRGEKRKMDNSSKTVQGVLRSSRVFMDSMEKLLNSSGKFSQNNKKDLTRDSEILTMSER